jgi:hypothetical protein
MVLYEEINGEVRLSDDPFKVETSQLVVVVL